MIIPESYGCLHIYIYNCIDRDKMSKPLSSDYITTLLIRHKIPTQLHQEFIKEMQQMGLVKLTSNNSIRCVKKIDDWFL